LNQSSAHRILNHVPGHVERVVVRSQDALEIARLPKTRCHSAPRPIRGPLFGERHERPKIRGVPGAFDKLVKMIRHVAVRQNCELEFGRGTKKLIVDGSDHGLFGEVAKSSERADCQEILLRAAV
jgi:hypothetical protein